MSENEIHKLLENAIQYENVLEEEKEDILKGYLKSILDAKQQAIILDKVGVGIKAPVSKPKTIAEAGQLAQDLLNKNNK